MADFIYSMVVFALSLSALAGILFLIIVYFKKTEEDIDRNIKEEHDKAGQNTIGK